jgi:hypothetical protein
MSYQLTNHDKWVRGRSRRQHFREHSPNNTMFGLDGRDVAPADAQDVVCCLTRGNWRRSLILSLVLNIIGTVGVFMSYYSSQAAGLEVVQGYFCLHDTVLCPITGLQSSIPTLDAKPDQSICKPSSASSTNPNPNINSSTTGGQTTQASCFATSTAECIQANGLGHAMALIESILHDGEMRLLNIPKTQRWLYVGCGFLVLHTLTFLVLECPRNRGSYSWASRHVPERIFGETISVICAQFFLKTLIIAFLLLTVLSSYTFPLNATCEDINKLPKNEEVAATVSSRKQFLTDCDLLHAKCHINIHGISLTWTAKDTELLTNYIIGCAMYVFLLLGAGVWKWTVWSCCVANTVVDGDVVERMDVDQRKEERDEEQREQFEEAIRRIQLKRKIRRERNLYGETQINRAKSGVGGRTDRVGAHGEGIDENGVWDGELVHSMGRNGSTPAGRKRNEQDIKENELHEESGTGLMYEEYSPTINSNRPRSYSPNTSSPTDTHVTLIKQHSSQELRPPTPGMFASHSYIISTNSNGQPTAQSVTQRVDERTGRIVTPTRKTRDPNTHATRNSPAKGSPQTPIEEDRVLDHVLENEKHEMPANEDGVPICIVCLDLLDVAGLPEKRQALRCGHVFHTDCIQQWFDEGGQGCVCPICRTRAD